MIRESRLQVRIQPKLKSWFKKYAEERGGMSHLVSKAILLLKEAEGQEEKTDGPAPAKE